MNRSQVAATKVTKVLWEAEGKAILVTKLQRIWLTVF